MSPLTASGRRMASGNSKERVASKDLPENLYKSYFKAIPDALLIRSARTGRYEDANPAALKLFGYTQDELRQMGPEDLTAEPGKTRTILRRFAAGERRSRRVLLRWARRKDGTLFPVQIAVGWMRYRGKEKIVSSLRSVFRKLSAEHMWRRLARAFPNDSFRIDRKTGVVRRLRSVPGLPVRAGRLRLDGGGLSCGGRGESFLCLGNARIDSCSRRIQIGRRTLEGLPVRHVEFLSLLAAARGRTVDRRHILLKLWRAPVRDREVDVLVSRLKARLEPRIAARIQTSRGNGYRLALI